MLRKIVGIFVCMLLMTTVYASTINSSGEDWNKTYGGNKADQGYCVRQTSDGGYIIVGLTMSYAKNGYADLWLIKTDASGNLEWDQTYGGTELDRGYSVRQTSDGGYIITGHTNSFGAGLYDLWLIKTDEYGEMQWQKTYGGKYMDSGYEVIETEDGCYIVVGYLTIFTDFTNSDVCLIKVDSQGNEIWLRKFDFLGVERGTSIDFTDDGGYIVTGTSWDFDRTLDIVLVKTDSEGILEWDNMFGAEDIIDYSSCVLQANDGGYLIMGYTEVQEEQINDALLIKTDENGEIQWQKTYGEYEKDDKIYDGAITDDGGYILTGYTYSYGAGNRDIWLIKTDQNGEMIWYRTFGGIGMEYASTVQQTNDEGYIIIGQTESYGSGGTDVWLIKSMNIPPEKPTLSGPLSGRPGLEYEFESRTTDPNRNKIYYWFDWGDGTDSGWVGPVNSGKTVSQKHTWSEQGAYEIKVKAKDIYGYEYGSESIWSDPLKITISKSRAINFDFNLLSWVFGRFPNLFPIIQKILLLQR